MATTEIETLMNKTGMQVQEICAALDIPTATLNRYKRGQGTMPPEKLEKLRKLAGGARPALRPLGSRKPTTAAVVEVPTIVLIEELARRARGGTLNDGNATRLDASRPSDTARPLRAVAFTDVADD